MAESQVAGWLQVSRAAEGVSITPLKAGVEA